MPAAAGDGLLGEPAAPGGDGGAEDTTRPAAACEGSFLPAWVSGVSRERLRDFQHHKRVGNYLIGSRKLGEGSFAKVREGLHVLTGEKKPADDPHVHHAASVTLLCVHRLWNSVRGVCSCQQGVGRKPW